MTWPFTSLARMFTPRRDSNDRQKQQLSESLERVLESTSQVREQAKAEQADAAHQTKEAITRRVKQANPLREVLVQVIERQREHHHQPIKDRH